MINTDFTIDIAYKSLNKKGEELCGDMVEVVKHKDFDIMILADGMGSGVKANILATMTSKILGTMFERGISLERCVETIIETLPVCKVRGVAYATFSILQVFHDGVHDGHAHLVEFDNPSCVFIRDGKLMPVNGEYKVVSGKRIKETDFDVEIGDAFVIFSDGAVNAGTGELLNFGWTWESIADFVEREYTRNGSALQLTMALSGACNDLYQYKPGDDTTVAVLKIGRRKVVHMMTGPASDISLDEKMVRDFMSDENAKRIVSGGTTSNIVSRVIGKPIDMSPNIDSSDSDVPPIAYIEGIDLVTEGVLTMNKAIKYLEQARNTDDVDEEFFIKLAEENGAALLADLLINDCTDLILYVGKAQNKAYENTDLSFNMGVRYSLVEKIADCMKKLGKSVEIKYY